MADENKQEKKADLLDRLDRVLGWIRACDMKTSILLAIIGLIITIFSSEFSLTEFKTIIDYNFNDFDFSNFLFLALTFIFFVSFCMGIICLVVELSPSMLSSKNNNKDIDSLYFFETISKKELLAFKDEILKTSIEEDINDVIKQLYINSKICTQKYRYTKAGVFYTMVGSSGILIMFLIGRVILYH
ncbi:hypothetical protein TEHN7126_1358 [Tetragenococcus halophilus subsp. halophilus]|uniref:Pycsar system effector family protein n=1 Tax=Tetragenococcus halophilus TaxID=51669 RepID=UPI000CA9CC57|nr:Pycsar system effector family protein [Tetragenococcus halophilus]GBD72197.1 hypothetical protein TEHN7125_0357 [Tetragenococcus halophilus subsp. halophilus]GBD75659.1 hypothetical protein TEHN7126_1358 [Tetragenococcus halophilus subsp. halophilus]